MRGRPSGSAASSGSSGLCIVGSACRFGSSREVAAAADSRLITIEVDGEEVTVDRYDVRLLLGEVAAFARQNCSEERRLAKLQESREIEEMRYEDLPRRAAFSDELPPQQQQQEQRQWTPTLEQQQKKEHRGSRAMSAANTHRDVAPAPDGGKPDFSAVPPPNCLDEPEAARGSVCHSASPPREGGAAVAAPEKAPGGAKEEAAEGPPDSSSSSSSAAAVEAETEEQQKSQQQPPKHQETDCFVPPFPHLPPNICLPESLREYLVVERTAHFVREEGDRMEFRLLLDEERRLPFLATSHRLHPFYCWLKQKGHSLIASAADLLPPRIRALLSFAYSIQSPAELQKQKQQEKTQEAPEPHTAGTKKQDSQETAKQQQQPPLQHDPDGGLGLLLSYGSDEEDRDTPEEEEQPRKEQQPEQQQQQEQQQEAPSPPNQQKEGTQASQESVPVAKKRPAPAPPLPATPTPAPKEDEAEEASDEDVADNDPNDLTSIWRSQPVTRFSLKKPKKEKTPKEEKEERDDSAGDIEAQLAALPEPPWALPSAKLGLSKASSLAIQQLGHHLLAAGDLSLVQHAKTYEDEASPFPFLWTSSMDFRYFRYVLKCVEAEIQKEGFVKPPPLPGPTHDMARSFLARLQLNHHLQQRKQQLLQQCMRLSEVTPDDPSLDYLKTVETAAAQAAATGKSAKNSVSSDTSSTTDNPTIQATPEATELVACTPAETGTPIAPAIVDAASTASTAAAESQLPPETAAHLQMLLQQMAAASAENDAATYMACYSAYCYAVAALSPEATAAAAVAAEATPAAAVHDPVATSEHMHSTTGASSP